MGGTQHLSPGSREALESATTWQAVKAHLPLLHLLHRADEDFVGGEDLASRSRPVPAIQCRARNLAGRRASGSRIPWARSWCGRVGTPPDPGRSGPRGASPGHLERALLRSGLDRRVR